LQEFVIREERVREGLHIMKQPNSIMVNEKWSLLAKSIFRLYKDLLLFETFAIMTYCSFSKILKKHDKVTGHDTRNAFMANVVNKANFTNYPQLLDMIMRCEKLYEEVSNHLLQDGNEGLYEDERLFLSMISRLNEQALDTAEEEGAPERPEGRREIPLEIPTGPQEANPAVKALRDLVEENDAVASATKIATSLMCSTSSRKRPTATSSRFEADEKKARIET
jgi:SPX domain